MLKDLANDHKYEDSMMSPRSKYSPQPERNSKLRKEGKTKKYDKISNSSN